jgi:hypothetical protein
MLILEEKCQDGYLKLSIIRKFYFNLIFYYFMFKFEKIIFDYLARIFFLKFENGLQIENEIKKYESQKKAEKILENEQINIKKVSFKVKPTFPIEIENSFISVLNKIEKNIKNVSDHMDENQYKDHLKQKWYFSSMVIDRLFFFLFTIFGIITFCSIILSSENFYKLN